MIIILDSNLLKGYKIIIVAYIMNSFTFIISTFFPEIDIFKTAFEFPADRNSPINQDFVSYSFINSLHFGRIKYENDSKISILNNCILKNYFMSCEKKAFFLENNYLCRCC